MHGDFLTAGRALYNNLDYSFAAGFERGTFQYPAYTPGGGGERLRRQLGYLVKFFDSYNLPPMAPTSRTIVGGDLDGASVRVLAEEGNQYAIYIHRGHVVQNQKPQYSVNVQPHVARLLLHVPKHGYRYAWVDPKNGRTMSEGFFTPTGETQELRSPEYREDIALQILDVSK